MKLIFNSIELPHVIKYLNDLSFDVKIHIFDEIDYTKKQMMFIEVILFDTDYDIRWCINDSDCLTCNIGKSFNICSKNSKYFSTREKKLKRIIGHD